MTRVRSRLAVGLAAIALALGAGTVHSPAHALSGEWVLGYTDSAPSSPDFAQPGDWINGVDVSFSIVFTFMGFPGTVRCENVPATDFNFVVPNPVPSAAPYTQMTIPVDTPATPLPCVESINLNDVEISFVSGSQWMFTADMPGAGSVLGEPRISSLSGSITIADGDPVGYGNGSVMVSLLTLPGNNNLPPCTFQWPAWVDVALDASYDPSFGTSSSTFPANLYVNNGTNSGFPPTSGIPANQANCAAVNNNASLSAIEISFEGPGGKTPTVVWAP